MILIQRVNNRANMPQLLYCSNIIYRVFQNLCHKLFLGIPHPKISKKVPINMVPKMNRFRDIDLRSCAGTLLSIT